VVQAPEEKREMDLGDMVVIDHPRHPFNGCVGKIVGRRGNRTSDDLWILIYIASRMRGYLVPQSMLRPEKKENDTDDQ
jgi:hypothetical protein